MAADTDTGTPEIEIAGRHTQAQLGKALLDATQRAREDDRITWVTSGGTRIAAVVSVEVGDARDIYTLLGPPARVVPAKIIRPATPGPATPVPVTGPAVQLQLEMADPGQAGDG